MHTAQELSQSIYNMGLLLDLLARLAQALLSSPG